MAQALPQIAETAPATVTPAASDAAGPSLLEQSLIGPTASLRDALAKIEASTSKICLVADQQRQLLGTVTDGDIRRAILRGEPFEAPVSAVMSTNPRTVPLGQARADTLSILQRESLRHLPVVDFAGRVVDLITLDSLLQPRGQTSSIVLMAGGKGTRLRPLTTKTPKPMLDVGGRPMLETVIRRCARAGFTDIFVTVHFHAEVIKAYFGDGRELGVTINYLEELQPLGTAGPLSLLPPRDEPVVVMNGDILTTVDLNQLIAYHHDSGAAATMAVREYTIQVPYGVVDLEGHQIAAIREKPRQRHFINAGIYVLSPAALRLIDQDAPLDMPELFARTQAAGLPALAYPVSEYWVDIGQIDDYQRANEEFPDFF